MSNLYYPWHSLKEGHWFKLICGASFQDLPAIRSLTLAYTLAGADCIDVAADPAVITAAQEGLQTAKTLAKMAVARGFQAHSLPWLMVSLNDGEDPHFRKAEFDLTQCPAECPRPCEGICPAQAIRFGEDSSSGVLDQRCYGCGRCLPVCPSQIIFTRSYVSTQSAIAPLIENLGIDAIEIHTQVGHWEDFRRLWQAIKPLSHQLKLLAISFPDAPQLIDYLQSLYDLIAPLPCPLIWQTDGRPMSGDIGIGTTHAAVKLAQKVLAARLPGYVQLAGGTNHHTVTKLQAMGLLKERSRGAEEQGSRGAEETRRQRDKEAVFNLQPSTFNFQPFISGIAYGSYARSLLSPILEKLETFNAQIPTQLEDCPDLLWQAVSRSSVLVTQLKPFLRDSYSVRAGLETRPFLDGAKQLPTNY